MSFRPHVLRVAAVTASLLAGPVHAESGRYHHHAHHRAVGGDPSPGRFNGYGGPRAYGGYYGAVGWEAAVNAQRTAQAYHEPGLTLELAPDSKQTATGGPSGGVPGFSGH